MSAVIHRSVLKQKNKPFKSKFSSKGSVKKGKKGRIDKRRSLDLGKSTLSKISKLENSRALIKQKQKKIKDDQKLFRGSGCITKIASIVPLCPDVTSTEILRVIYYSFGLECPDSQMPTLWSEKFRQRFQFIPLERNTRDVIDACLVSDIVIFALSGLEEVDSLGEKFISVTNSMGVSLRCGVVNNLNLIDTKRGRHDAFKSLSHYMKESLSGEDEVFDTSNPTKLISWLTRKTPSAVSWRENRSYLLSNKVEFLANEESPDKVTLVMSGHVRGAPLSADRILYVPDVGIFQVEKIQKHKECSSMESDDNDILDVPTSCQEPLIESHEPDPMDTDQPWITDHDIAESRKNAFVRVPKGTSKYQACWFIDEDSDFDDNEGYDRENNGISSYENGNENEAENSDEVESYEDMEMSENNDTVCDFDDTQGDEQDRSKYMELIAKKKNDEKEQREFPDELELGFDVKARDALAKYRGLKSFRTSAWDPYEDLPLDYAKISQIKSFKRIQVNSIRKTLEGKVPVGSMVDVFIKNFPTSALKHFNMSKPPLFFALHEHEAKYTLLNFTLSRKKEYDGVIKSKDKLVLQYGFRRIHACPIYSTNSKGGLNNVHKFERYFYPGRTSIASIYGPICFGTVPTIAFYCDDMDVQNGVKDNLNTMVAYGTLDNMDTNRIIAKRAVLTGHPYKIHKHSAVIRYMFFNAEDVEYFKPIELRTKLGLRGNIIESVGTHGRMKCRFSGSMKAHDTVCLCLYKRVFPKWTTSQFTIPDPKSPIPCDKQR